MPTYKAAGYGLLLYISVTIILFQLAFIVGNDIFKVSGSNLSSTIVIEELEDGAVEMKKQLFTFIMATAIFFGVFIGKSMDAHAIDNNNSAQGAATAFSDPDFDAAYYAHRYPDLMAAGLRTPEELYQHWITYGKAEGRVGSQTYTVPKYLIPTPKVFSSDFDAAYYAHRYPDLMAAGLRTPEQLYQHWITYGKAEGRTGKP